MSASRIRHSAGGSVNMSTTGKMSGLDAYRGERLYMRTPLHENTFTREHLYRQASLHTNAFTDEHLYARTLLQLYTFTDEHIYSQKHLQSKQFTVEYIYSRNLYSIVHYRHRYLPSSYKMLQIFLCPSY